MGTMIMGRILDAAEIQHLAEMTRVPIDIEWPSDMERDPSLLAAASAISDSRPVFAHPASDESFATYQRLNAIYGQPAGLMRPLLPRTIPYQQRTTLPK